MTDANVTPVTNPKPPIVVLRERLEARRDELRNALTDIDPNHFIRVLITSAQVNPDLQACNFSSLWLACMRACRDNLLPDGVESAIVPFKDKATYIPMYRGLLKKFRQSGECKWITANVVREGEVFEHWIDEMGEHFKHVPGISDGIAPVERVYAAALTKDGAFYCAVMTMAEINKVKAQSRAAREDSPWRQWPDEMAKKTALRRLSKLLPAGRDVFAEEDEDQPRDLPPLPSGAPLHIRPQGAAAALDSFAGQGDQEFDQRDHLEIAYERGKIAKESGALRRSLPGEYREVANEAEAKAWYAGFDGISLESEDDGETPAP